MYLRIVLFCSLLFSFAAGAASQPATTGPSDLARQNVEDLFLLRDLRFECKDFSYYPATKTLAAKNVALIPDSGAARVAARQGHPLGPWLRVASATVTIAKDIHPNSYPSPVTVVLDHPVLPLPEGKEARAQRWWHFMNLLHFVTLAGATEWTELLQSEDGHSNPIGAYPDLRELTVRNWAYETISEDQKTTAKFVLSLHIQRDAATHWKGEMKIGIRTPKEPKGPLEGPVHFELKVEKGKLLIRCTDPPETQPETQPATQKK